MRSRFGDAICYNCDKKGGTLDKCAFGMRIADPAEITQTKGNAVKSEQFAADIL